jgi:peptide deformylase
LARQFYTQGFACPWESSVKIVTYPHPTLRYVSKPVRKVNADFRKLVREMFDLMYDANGIGLAANQVDLPLRLFIINLAAKRGEGEELVFINPVLSHHKGSDEAEEGCLSLPGMYGQVVRPKTVRVQAYNLQGEEIKADLTGLLAKCVQHEYDHIDGVLFPDRMPELTRSTFIDQLAEFETDFHSRRSTGGIPSDEEIAKARAEWESKYC